MEIKNLVIECIKYDMYEEAKQLLLEITKGFLLNILDSDLEKIFNALKEIKDTELSFSKWEVIITKVINESKISNKSEAIQFFKEYKKYIIPYFTAFQVFNAKYIRSNLEKLLEGVHLGKISA